MHAMREDSIIIKVYLDWCQESKQASSVQRLDDTQRGHLPVVPAPLSLVPVSSRGPRMTVWQHTLRDVTNCRCTGCSDPSSGPWINNECWWFYLAGIASF